MTFKSVSNKEINGSYHVYTFNDKSERIKRKAEEKRKKKIRHEWKLKNEETQLRLQTKDKDKIRFNREEIPIE